MKITTEWLEKEEACEEGVRWFADQNLSDTIEVVESLIKYAPFSAYAAHAAYAASLAAYNCGLTNFLRYGIKLLEEE